MTEPRFLDIAQQIGAIRRDVAEDGDLVRVQMDRRYPSPTTDVWDALTDPARISRWMMPISGDFRVGGTFQLEGNAGGEILHCRAAARPAGDLRRPESLVEVRLVTPGDGNRADLEHTVPRRWPAGWRGALRRPGLGRGAPGPGSLPCWPRERRPGRRSELAGGAGVLPAESVSAWVGAIESSGAAAARSPAPPQVAMAQFAPDLVG